jgi:hypothetical protein
VGVAEIGNGAPFRIRPLAARISRDGLSQVIFDLLPHAPRQGSIKTQLAREQLSIFRD